MQRFLQFLRDLHPLIDDTLPEHSPTLLQAKVSAELDYRLPFREKAPSRTKILASPDGPFSPDHISTREGIFSALIFRGITFCTKALLEIDHSGYFDSLEAWNSFVNAHGPYQVELASGWAEKSAAEIRRMEECREAYFCNKGPYGRTKGRSTANASQFWTASGILHNYLNKGHNLYEVMVHMETEHDELDNVVYPTFGKLAAYLLAVDLVYAGRIPSPTSDVMVQCVNYMQMGALDGLSRLGLVEGEGVHRKPHTAAAFLGLYSYLQSNLTEKERSAMGLDMPLVEHGLCKFKRNKV